LLSAVITSHEAAIGEGIVDGLTDFEYHHSEDAFAELRNSSPEPDASVWLHFLPERIGQDPFTPLPADVRALLKHDGLKVPGRLEHVLFALVSLSLDPWTATPG
jgi:hypothetical protein